MRPQTRKMQMGLMRVLNSNANNTQDSNSPSQHAYDRCNEDALLLIVAVAVDADPFTVRQYDHMHHVHTIHLPKYRYCNKMYVLLKNKNKNIFCHRIIL